MIRVEFEYEIFDYLLNLDRVLNHSIQKFASFIGFLYILYIHIHTCMLTYIHTYIYIYIYIL